jgi:hypothetical protein
VQIPDQLKDKVARAAQQRGMTLEASVRLCISTVVDRRHDSLFADTAVYAGEAPATLSKDHDEFLYGEQSNC